MLRFLAFVWDPGCESASLQVQQLSQSLTAGEEWADSFLAHGLRVLHTGQDRQFPEVHRLGDSRGVVLGRVFVRRAPPSALRVEELIDTAWGRYVAFESDPDSRAVKIVRSPAGALDCFYAHLGTVQVFFCDVADYVALNAAPASINWPWMATLLAYPRHALGAAATGIRGIEQLQPGECFVCMAGGKTSRRLLWNPFQIAAAQPIDDFAAAAAAIHEATQLVVSSWAGCYRRIILLLSGGLDSSIVLSCLRGSQAPPEIHCLTYYSHSCITGDERFFARLSAERAGVALHEVEEQTAETDLTQLMRLESNAIPWTYILYVRHSVHEGRFAAATSADAIFSGTAGDQIFFHGPAVLAAADYLRRRGCFVGFISYSLNVARRNKLSLWSVLATAARDRFSTPRYDSRQDVESPNRLTTRQAFEEADGRPDIRHYWMPFASGVPRGKLLHVMMTDCPQDLRDPFGAANYPERVHPLNSQPLIETCLRIPTDVLTHAGYSRAAARHAFADDLPAAVLSRTSKGYIDSLNAQLLERNLAWVRELLLDGQLVAHGLIDRRKLEALLTREQIRLSPAAGEVLCEHLSYEAWLHNWAATTPS